MNVIREQLGEASQAFAASERRRRTRGRTVAGMTDEEYERRSQLQAAIFIPVLEVDGSTRLLFTKRSSNVSTHKGQVSFPGGHIDPGETVIEAAVRELCEEVLHGYEEQQADLIASKDDVVRGSDDFLKIEILGDGPTLRAVTGTMCSCVVGVLTGDVVESENWSRSVSMV